MFWQTAFAASLLATGARAGVGALMADGASRNSPSVDRLIRDVAKAQLQAGDSIPVIRARQSMGSNVVLNQDGSINMTEWDALANLACNEALSNLPEASNPSGTCICYNLPALDNITGTFEADLRLYQLSDPSGQFAGIAPENIQVGLSYRGASVSPVTTQTASRIVTTRQNSLPNTNPSANTNTGQLRQLQTYLFVGQIDKTQMSPTMTM